MYFLYGVACHLLFLGTFVYMAGFVGNVFVSKSIDSGTVTSWPAAVAVNLVLISLFALQHSVMARPAFKRWWMRIIPEPIERSTYVLLTCIVTGVLIWQWRPLNAVVWGVTSPALRAGLWFLFLAGWLSVPLVSLLINHFDLFGTRQVWLYLRGREYTPLPFGEPSVYKHVRHPLYIGWGIAFWVSPTMTWGHLMFAATMTAYMGLAALFEERDLIAHFGRSYEDYRRRVPMFVPYLNAAARINEPATTVQAIAAEECHV
jgi:protein-S-isoprenylcysteine O-methyltransferase Ste14